ncbi:MULTISPECIES: type II toxin-antitoxin system YafQ family toxin [Bifidobacterium]|jgi:mRNA interferase YafQ|uniref:type II toxin-antitoxin system YafQ family toxin n=1 Tax=Bifidobacterium TaxID=1678 RepID=UPI0023539433|nr:type II toxin-antitoxin system YafQ family toxin [Bifidobacterium tibiigranuli]MCI1798148.1 type II toxin-antitoxin system YafQ family toxin [Bifidobacterium tibiigranuli]
MIEVFFSTNFDRDVSRLLRRHPMLADDLFAAIDDELAVDGAVNQAYQPHVLDNRGGIYGGCMEFHLADNVLVIFSPPSLVAQ